MQTELLAENPATAIRILGINSMGSETGNAAMCDGRDIPWLQDTITEQVWIDWGVTWRDVVILDRDNHVAAVYNLTVHNLADPANYAELKALFKQVAGE